MHQDRGQQSMARTGYATSDEVHPPEGRGYVQKVHKIDAEHYCRWKKSQTTTWDAPNLVK